ncbi:ATP F0F1 synthase subunit B [uncultured Rhodoblastus sp.]|uniref:F0F1 ATP synthase subunit B family protein n=1 Tax=uncultured Rhodoblastus sp. TaxID=543037 RepID=UPI0025F9357E|nr:ATP F0F1 synthase subunit B [uncultured Rhodoblastus sp.]
MDAEFFVALGFILFVMVLGYLGVHKTLGGALDGRIAKIKDELAEASRLRAEAQALMQSFAAKTAEAEAQAASIVAQARAEAEAIAKETQVRLEEYVARRTKQAQDKIAQAEAQATADVRAAAADAAVKAAETVLKTSASGAGGAGFIQEGISSIKTLVN